VLVLVLVLALVCLVLLLLAVVLAHLLATRHRHHSPASHLRPALLPVWLLVGWCQFDLMVLLLLHPQIQVVAASAAAAPAAGQAVLRRP
jgi:hypothetical protein